MDSVITDEAEDITCLNTLPPLQNGNDVVLSFKFGDCGIIYGQALSCPSVWQTNISATNEFTAATDWSVNTRLSIKEAWSIRKGSVTLVTSAFISRS